ncbi:Molybdopterin biosynthesis MoaE [Microthyrium microscopicum]|uniref:Molybdopterin biosynthesis MoaE n=1 Tax=Microthyrium microscopicum TaxID=703497 RepID=A0A6A6URH0_9PEZI|nr:Molybdopterin biosynthesis MoaE [Microthyrium microscopicum]
MGIAQAMKQKHSLNAIAIVHRLGEVPVGQESILIAVSTPHRKAAWLAGEETLEEVKEKVEIWKYERFEDGGAWRANRDGFPGQVIENASSES